VIPDKDVLDRLVEGGFDLSTIETLVLSHHHFDHIGDIDALPPQVSVVCGPGTLEEMRPGYPDDQEATWWSRWFKDRKFLEMPSTNASKGWDGPIADCVNPQEVERNWEKLGCHDHAVDWFGDGSLWLVDTPGVRGLFEWRFPLANLLQS
jgi:glyoxylase-like metal-dependent hydrolase (beta-lactamase superfamily II)